jgi:hypothetical protein
MAAIPIAVPVMIIDITVSIFMGAVIATAAVFFDGTPGCCKQTGQAE